MLKVATKRFAFVHQYDEKPKRRLYETLKMQGLQMHQSITFLSDGGDTVRKLQMEICPTPTISWTGSTLPCGSPP